jgi:hypothetical protein
VRDGRACPPEGDNKMNCAEDSREHNHRECDGFDGPVPKTPPIRTAASRKGFWLSYGSVLAGRVIKVGRLVRKCFRIKRAVIVGA